jgi:hypothetical protein
MSDSADDLHALDVHAEWTHLLGDLMELRAMKREYQQLRAEKCLTKLTKYPELRERLEALHTRIGVQLERLERLQP